MGVGQKLNHNSRVTVEPGGGGATGATGASGATGAGGSTGATGAGVFVPSFAHFFALMPGDNSATVAVGAAVQFPQNGPTDGVATRASASTFTIPVAGTYKVDFQVSVTEAGQLQLAIGGAGLPDTVAGRATGTSQISQSSVITVSAGAVLSVINPAGNSTALTITTTAGGASSVSATLTIVRLA
jgi:BclA C-terminal domain